LLALRTPALRLVPNTIADVKNGMRREFFGIMGKFLSAILSRLRRSIADSETAQESGFLDFTIRTVAPVEEHRMHQSRTDETVEVRGSINSS
jgi:hypothetical protein